MTTTNAPVIVEPYTVERGKDGTYMVKRNGVVIDSGMSSRMADRVASFRNGIWLDGFQAALTTVQSLPSAGGGQ